MNERMHDVMALAGNYLHPVWPARSEDQAALAEFLRVYGMYKDVSLLDAAGKLIAHSGGLYSGEDWGQAPRIGGLRKAFVEFNRSARTVVIRLVSPIADSVNGQLRGMLCADLPVSEIWAFLHAITSSDDEYFVSDADGKIFLATEAADLGLPLGDVFPALAPLIASKKTGTARVRSSVTGARFLVAYVPAESSGRKHRLGWGFVVGTRLDIAYAPQRRLLGIVAGGTLITALLGALISILITRSATRRLLAEIENRKEIALELAAARDLAVETARLKSEFLANMSHEIRTPLHGIIGMSGLLMDTGLSEEQREFAQVIGASADSLLGIVNDILDFSKIAAGKLVLEETDFELALVLESVVDLLAERAHQKQIELALAIDLDVPRFLRGDPARLRQVLNNLAGNAVKFTEHGEVVVRVGMVSASERDVLLRFSVTDTGIGIAEQAKVRLFDAFSQADSSTTRKYGGTGLGLAIARQLVECMGGEISVRSTPGQGSTFQFTARLRRSAHTSSALSGRTDLSGVRVLIVDDNATNCQILQRQLGGWGMVSHSVFSGAQALTALRDHAAGLRYDLAIIDLEMPGMDGVKLAQLIRTEAAIADTRLLMMSSRGSRTDAGDQTAPVDAWLIKPVKAAQLYRALSAVCAMEKIEPVSILPLKLSPQDSRVREMRRDLRVLVAEDNPVAQKVAVRQLQKLGITPDVADNGRAALEALDRAYYSIVLMDCQMPELDGFAATTELRRRETGHARHIVIAMTANAMQGDREKCLAAGMDDYISKPVKLEELAAILDRWLSQAAELQSREQKGESADVGSSPPSV